ncbi:MAG: Uracil-DNA glycosylase [Alphaproteobacteria bacterium]|nr:Uracil-DNA glycosylase [Alphaproteobacteria bacterium]
MNTPLAPPHDCPLCPRLVAFREANRAKYPDWFNGPVPSFGPLTARLLIAGLAPGLQGANRTGRPFTGDWAGDLLYATLLKAGLAKGVYDERIDDTLELVNCRIANSVRCVPPQNKPEPSEIKTCRQFLISELDTLPNVKVILALGKIAHDSVLKTLDAKISAHPFKHGVAYDIGRFTLISSYHCSRYNTNTGVLTTSMFENVVSKAKALAGLE